jgi:peptidylprolyl isomerase
MGTDKRQRQKEGRQARIAAAEQARRKSDNRKRIFSAAGIALAIVVLIIGFAVLKKNDSPSSQSATTTTSAGVTSTTAAMESAAGKPCVALADPLPAGAPDVPVVVGPAPTALVTKDLKDGTGAVVAAGDTVTVNYIGVSCSTGKLFDSSYKTGTGVPITFPLAQVIPGWTNGVPGMKVGGMRLLGIPSGDAYGPQGRPPTIAPDEALWFVVEVTATAPTPASTTTAAVAPTP